MKKRLLYIITSVCLIPACVHAQNKPAGNDAIIASSRSNAAFTFQQLIPGDFISMDVDVLDNIYLVTAGNQLKKLDAKADSIAAFNDVKKYGNPSLIDVSNPLKVLVYYKNFSTAVILDRLLTVRHTINFRKQNIFSVKAIATSYDNNIWLFDEQDYKLKKIDDEGSLLQESTDMRLLVDSVPSPGKITDNDDFVYLYDEQRGFFVFDHYGALKNSLPFLHWSNTAVAHNKMYGFVSNKLLSYELSSLNLKQYELPAFIKDYTAIKAINGKVYLLKKEGVEIYTVN